MERELELVIVGSGPAGLSAALAARETGAPVTLLDAYPVPGGQYFRQPPERLSKKMNHHQSEGRETWQKALAAGVEILPNILVWGGTAEKVLYTSTPQGSGTIQAKALILATGAYERPAAFPGWTLPGVLMTGGAQTLLYQGVLPGKRVLLAGTGPLQLVVAKKLLDAGAEVAAVLEGTSGLIAKGVRHALDAWGQWERLSEGASAMATLIRHAVPYRMGWGILEAHGDSEVQGATIARLDESWRPIPGSEQQVDCDTVCIGFGFVPFNTLGRVLGAGQVWDFSLGGEVPQRDENLQTSVPGLWAAGDGAGIGGVRMSQIEGRIAGLAAAASLGYGAKAMAEERRKLEPALRREKAFQKMYAGLFTPGPGLFELAKDDTLVCRCEGATLAKVRSAVMMGANSFGEIKSYTRAGMGECQGRMCGQEVIHLIAKLTGKKPGEVGAANARFPVFPLPIQSLIIEE